MSSRKGIPLTEMEAVKLRGLLKDRKDKQLFYVYELLIGTGIRRSDWKPLAKRYQELKVRTFDVMIPKQSRIINGVRELEKRYIKLPETIWDALQSGEWELNPYSGSWVREKVKKIQTIAHANGISRPISPHDFRHTFVMFAKHRGFDMPEVMSTTMHKDPKSFMKYWHADLDIIEAVYDSLNSDAFDITQPKLIMKKLNKEKQKTKILEAKIAVYEERYGKL